MAAEAAEEDVVEEADVAEGAMVAEVATAMVATAAADIAALATTTTEAAEAVTTRIVMEVEEEATEDSEEEAAETDTMVAGEETMAGRHKTAINICRPCNFNKMGCRNILLLQASRLSMDLTLPRFSDVSGSSDGN